MNIQLEIFKIHTPLVMSLGFHIAIIINTKNIYRRPTVKAKQRTEDSDTAFLHVRMRKRLTRCYSLKSISVKLKFKKPQWILQRDIKAFAALCLSRSGMYYLITVNTSGDMNLKPLRQSKSSACIVKHKLTSVISFFENITFSRYTRPKTPKNLDPIILFSLKLFVISWCNQDIQRKK